MPTSNDAVTFLTGPDAPATLRWLNTDRKSHDWKVKVLQHDPSGLQLAIYDRAGIRALLEHAVKHVAGTALQPVRPKSDALKGGESRFASKSGAYYEVNDLSALHQLVAQYLRPQSKATPDLAEFSRDLEEKVAKALSDDSEARKARLALSPIKPKKVAVVTTVFDRSSDVIAEVLLRAAGVCEGCGQAAPFKRRSSGTPYLEVHHKKPLAEGGDDTVANAIALCPNCHRQRHYG